MHVGVCAHDAAGLLDVVGDAVELGAPAGVVAEHLGAGAGDHVRLHVGHAGVERVDLGELYGMLVDEVGHPPQDLGSLVAGQSRPDSGFEGGPRRATASSTAWSATVGELGDGLLGCRLMIEIVSPVPGRRPSSSSTACKVMELPFQSAG